MTPPDQERKPADKQQPDRKEEDRKRPKEEGKGDKGPEPRLERRSQA